MILIFGGRFFLGSLGTTGILFVKDVLGGTQNLVSRPNFLFSRQRKPKGDLSSGIVGLRSDSILQPRFRFACSRRKLVAVHLASARPFSK